MQSLQSELIEEIHLSEASPSATNAGSQESLTAENCQIDNYQDALKFLKNYNNQGMKTTQKPVQQKRGNDTINRIKRMRKIDDQNNQENNICQGNEGPCAIVHSKLEYTEEEGKSCASIASSKFRSRVKEAAVSLEEPVRAVTELLKHIGAASQHALKKERIQDKFAKLSFVGGLQYVGSCN